MSLGFAFNVTFLAFLFHFLAHLPTCILYAIPIHSSVLVRRYYLLRKSTWDENQLLQSNLHRNENLIEFPLSLGWQSIACRCRRNVKKEVYHHAPPCIHSSFAWLFFEYNLGFNNNWRILISSNFVLCSFSRKYSLLESDGTRRTVDYVSLSLTKMFSQIIQTAFNCLQLDCWCC